jgi:hypothetical protein
MFEFAVPFCHSPVHYHPLISSSNIIWTRAFCSRQVDVDETELLADREKLLDDGVTFVAVEVRRVSLNIVVRM